MMFGPGKELTTFIQSLLTGNLLYLVYTVLRVWRLIIRHNLLWISVEDLIYWIGAGVYLFVKIYETCSGTIRWYFVIGAMAGAAITHCIIKKSQKYIAKRFKRE